MSGEELKRRREALGLTVYELAYAFDVMPSSVYRWEDGKTALKGLTAIGADVVLKEFERKRRAAQRGQEG